MTVGLSIAINNRDKLWRKVVRSPNKSITTQQYNNFKQQNSVWLHEAILQFII